MKQFDKDYDVFYPFVKNHVFSSGMSFQQVLSSYEKFENQLVYIENMVPKLTVLVPDFSWIDPNCFSVKNWDTTENQSCVSFDDRGNEEHSLYYNGELLGLLPTSAFPSFPVLIVKSNERMICSPKTKSGEIEYSFADLAFDGYNDTKSMWGSTADYWANPEPGVDLFSQVGNFIPKTELIQISPSVIRAYDEFKTGSTSGVQRDYVYYGMTKQNSTHGSLNPFKRDMLYRFRLTPEGLFFISDDITKDRMSTEDPNVSNSLETGRGDRPSFTEAIPRLWGNGNYEIRLQFFQAYPNGDANCVSSIVLSISPGEIMYVDKCYRTFQWNVFGNNWSSYTITSSDIESKWYYPGDKNNPLPMIEKTWDLSKESSSLFMKVLEYDPSSTKTVTESCSYRMADSATFAIFENEQEKTSLGIIFDDEESSSASFTYTITAGSDDLGGCEMNYIDNYILSSTFQNGKNGYQLKAYGNSYFSASFLPVDMKDEYQIQEFLLERKSRNN